MTADELEATLGLTRHTEGGAFVEIFRHPDQVRDRSLGTVIHFMLRAGEHSAWHRVSSDEIWLYQGGDALSLHVGDAVVRLDLGHPSARVPAGVWQAAVPVPGGSHGFTLVACVVVPGFDFADFALASPAEAAALPPLPV